MADDGVYTCTAMRMADPVPTFSYLVSRLARDHNNLAYLHIIEPGYSGNLDTVAKAYEVGLLLHLMCMYRSTNVPCHPLVQRVHSQDLASKTSRQCRWLYPGECAASRRRHGSTYRLWTALHQQCTKNCSSTRISRSCLLTLHVSRSPIFRCGLARTSRWQNGTGVHSTPLKSRAVTTTTHSQGTVFKLVCHNSRAEAEGCRGLKPSRAHGVDLLPIVLTLWPGIPNDLRKQLFPNLFRAFPCGALSSETPEGDKVTRTPDLYHPSSSPRALLAAITCWAPKSHHGNNASTGLSGYLLSRRLAPSRCPRSIRRLLL